MRFFLVIGSRRLLVAGDFGRVPAPVSLSLLQCDMYIPNWSLSASAHSYRLSVACRVVLEQFVALSTASSNCCEAAAGRVQSHSLVQLNSAHATAIVVEPRRLIATAATAMVF